MHCVQIPKLEFKGWMDFCVVFLVQKTFFKSTMRMAIICYKLLLDLTTLSWLGTGLSHVLTNPEFSVCNCFGFFWERAVFSIKITVIVAFYNLFWFLNENPLRKDKKTKQISWEKFRFRRFGIRENMWWTRYRWCLSRNIDINRGACSLPLHIACLKG